MSLATAPHRAPILPVPDDAEIHVFCCRYDIFACGLVRPKGFVDVPDDTEVDCPLCRIADEEELPCGAPDCPYLEAS